jgi:hypothetical protein
MHATPSPTLPRTRGRGQTESAALLLAKTRVFIGANAAEVLAKQRIGSRPGICYDSAEHLP